MKSKKWRDRIVLLEDEKEVERDKGGTGREVLWQPIILTVSNSCALEALKAILTQDPHHLTSGNYFSLGAWQSQAKENKKKAEEEH